MVIGVHIVPGTEYAETKNASIVIKGRLRVIHAVNSGQQLKMKTFLDNVQ